MIGNSRKANKLCLGLMIGFLVISMGIGALPVEKLNSDSQNDAEFNLAQGYEPHANIWIQSNEEFLTQAATEGWNGTGAVGDPIIISGYSFFATGPQPVRIWNTDLQWVFRDNHLSTRGTWCGLNLEYTTTGLVVNNTFEFCHSGVYMVDVENVIIENNTFFDGTGHGVEGDGYISNVTVRYNHMYDLAVHGIFCRESYDIQAYDNLIEDVVVSGVYIEDGEDNHIWNNNIVNARFGVRLSFTSTGSIVENNTIQQISKLGVELSADSNTVRGNLIRDVDESGIVFTNEGSNFAENNVVEQNTVINCTKFSIQVGDSCIGNTISENSLFECGEVCHVSDSGTDTTITDNFYDCWSSPDADSDGVVDYPYSVLGTAENADPTPRASPTTSLPDDYEYIPMTPTATDEGPLPLMEIAIVAGVGLVICILVVIFIKKK